MNAATCAALSAVFPLTLLALGVERRNLNLRMRRLRWFRRLALAGLASALVGTVLAVVGIQLDGWSWPSAFIIWAAFAVSTAALAVTLVMLMATHEIEEDKTKKR